MVAHQTVRMYSDAVPLGNLGEKFKIVALIGGFIKTQRAIIAALNNVVRHTCSVKTGAAGHSKLLLLLILALL